jgi:glycosyltransferase involved in cell wall biosynthesis
VNETPLLVHVTTTDVSLTRLLGPQLRAFKAEGYDVIGVSAPGAHVGELEAWGISHQPLRHATRAFDPVRDVQALGELVALFRRLRPDIVHTHNPKPGLYGRVAARVARVPVIVNTVHGLYAVPEDRWRKRAVVYSLERVAGLFSDLELVQNPEDLETLAGLGVPRRKMEYLGNGIDLDRFDPARVDHGRRAAIRSELGVLPDELLCGTVGRLVWEKGYRELFDAAARLRREAPNVRVVAVGGSDSDKADALRSDEIDAARHAGVIFTGDRSDVVDLYAAMDVFVHASHREGFPRSPMEAEAMGLPVIATNIRGCRQVVDDGETGLLVPVRDATALAAAIVRLASEHQTRERMRRAARAKALQDFDDKRVVKTTLDNYSMLRERSRTRHQRPIRALARRPDVESP